MNLDPYNRNDSRNDGKNDSSNNNNNNNNNNNTNLNTTVKLVTVSNEIELGLSDSGHEINSNSKINSKNIDEIIPESPTKNSKNSKNNISDGENLTRNSSPDKIEKVPYPGTNGVWGPSGYTRNDNQKQNQNQNQNQNLNIDKKSTLKRNNLIYS